LDIALRQLADRWAYDENLLRQPADFILSLMKYRHLAVFSVNCPTLFDSLFRV